MSVQSSNAPDARTRVTDADLGISDSDAPAAPPDRFPLVAVADSLRAALNAGALFRAADFFGAEARTDDEANLLKSGKITRRELDNRLLLRKIMLDNGLRKITSEWWHFNLMSADEARAKLKIIE